MFATSAWVALLLPCAMFLNASASNFRVLASCSACWLAATCAVTAANCTCSAAWSESESSTSAKARSTVWR